MLEALDAAWAGLPLGMRLGFGFALGAVHGWFAAVVVERVPQGIGVSGVGESPRSSCVCGRQLSPVENLPILSYLALHGRARCCGAAIPRWYLGAEVGMGAWWAAAWSAPWLLAAVGGSLAGFAGLVAGGLAWQRR